MVAAWKLVYFGDVLPNTFYAKAGGGMPALRAGLEYVYHFARNFGLINLVLVVVAVVAGRIARPVAAVTLSAIVVAYGLHVASVGGDYQYFSRYLVPLLPLLVALGAAGLVPLWDAVGGGARLRRAAITACVLGAGLLTFVLPSLRELRDRPWLLTRPWRLVEELPKAGEPDASLFHDDFRPMGQLLERTVPAGRTIGVIAVGAIGYYCDRPILDMLGLNDRRIARLPVERPESRKWIAGHMKGNASAVLDRRPEYLLLSFRPSSEAGQPPSTTVRKTYPFVADLLETAEFERSYVLDACALPDGRWMNIYRRSDLPPLECAGPVEG